MLPLHSLFHLCPSKSLCPTFPFVPLSSLSVVPPSLSSFLSLSVRRFPSIFFLPLHSWPPLYPSPSDSQPPRPLCPSFPRHSSIFSLHPSLPLLPHRPLSLVHLRFFSTSVSHPPSSVIRPSVSSLSY